MGQRMVNESPFSDASAATDALAESCLVVELFDASSRLAYRYAGPTARELEQDHEAGRCHATCSHCHQLLADETGEQAAFEAMYVKCFDRPFVLSNR